MFKRFMSQHSFSEYNFQRNIFPTVEDRVFWDKFPNEACVKTAEGALGYEWPLIKATDFMEFKKSGNRKIMENPHFARRRYLSLFTLAELKENKGRFLPQVVNGLFAICEETYWGVSAHWVDNARNIGNIPRADEPYIDLFAAETAEHLAMVAYLLRNPLKEFCPEILERVAYELEGRIKFPYLTHQDFWWMGYGHNRTNNWNPWILSNLLTVFLLTEAEELRLHRALKKMMTEIQFYYEQLPEDGGCDEGPGYWGQAGASLFEFVYQLKQATSGSLDLFSDEKLGRIAAYMKKVHVISDCFVNVADAHMRGHMGAMPMLYGFARETKQCDLMNFSAAVYKENPLENSRLLQMNNIRRVLYCTEFLAELEACSTHYPLHNSVEYLPDLQLALLRRGDWILSAKGGHNEEHHNHNDVGSFTLYDKTTPVLIDVGIGTYTRFTFQSDTRYTMIPWTQSLYHSLPVINETGQLCGKTFHSENFAISEGEAEISFAKAYPVKAGIKGLTRKIVLNENGMCLTDLFSFEDDNCQKVTEVLMSILPVRIEDNTAILDERYRISASCGTFRTEFISFEDPLLEADWKTKGVSRILLDVAKADEITLSVEKI